jgi:hypothetical protein
MHFCAQEIQLQASSDPVPATTPVSQPLGQPKNPSDPVKAASRSRGSIVQRAADAGNSPSKLAPSVRIHQCVLFCIF